MIIAGDFGKLTKKGWFNMNYSITLGNVSLVRNFISFTFIGKLNDLMVLEFVHDQNGNPFYRIHQIPQYHFEDALEIAKEAIPLLFNSKERVRLISNGFLNITTVYE